VSATTLHPIHLVAGPTAPAYPVSADFADPNHDSAAGMPWRAVTALTDLVGLFAIVWTLPFVILLVGAPFGLALWLARVAFGAL